MTVLPQTAQVATIHVGDLLAAVKDAQRSIGRTVAPILAGIRLHILPDGRLEVTTFNYELSVTKRVPATGAIPDVLVSAVMLKKSLDRLDKKQTVDMFIDGEKLTLVQGTRRVGLALMNLEEYPDLPKAPKSRVFTILGEHLQDVGKRLTVFASRDQMLPPLTGVHFAVEGGELIAGVTDRFRAALAVYPVVGNSEPFSGIVPSMALIGSMFGDTDVVAAKYDDKLQILHLDSPDTTITVRLIDAEFPRLRQLFPTGPFEVTATFEPTAFLEAIGFVAEGVERNGSINVAIDDGQVTLSNNADDDWAEMRDSVPATLGGQNPQLGMLTGFNPPFLADAVKTWGKGHDVTIAFMHPYKPAVFTSDAAPHVTVLCMPRRMVS